MFYVNGSTVMLDVAPGREDSNQGNSSNPNYFFPDININTNATESSMPDVAKLVDKPIDNGKKRGRDTLA